MRHPVSTLSRLKNELSPAVSLRVVGQAIDPSAPSLIFNRLRLQHAKALDESPCDRLLAEARTVEESRDRCVHLPRRDRLYEIPLERRADRLGHRRILLALRHHHDEEVRVGLAKLAERVEAALARHLLVEQHDVERATANHLDGVIGVRRHFDVEPFVAQEYAMRLEELRLVVNPEDGFRRLRHSQNIVGRCARSAERSRLPRFSAFEMRSAPMAK